MQKNKLKINRKGLNSSDQFKEQTKFIVNIVNIFYKYGNCDFPDEIDAVSYGRARRRSWKYSRNNNAADGDVRRSSRQRKMIYGTFDQKILEKALYMNGDDMQPGRKRKRNEVELVDVEVLFHVSSLFVYNYFTT